MKAQKEKANKMIKDLSFCVFDLETTGGNLKSDKIIEIGLVKISNLEIKKSMNFLIQPNIKIPDFIQKLTHITPKDVKDAPVIEDVIEEILKFMGDSILVAHNTSFDIPFFNSVLRRMDMPELKNNSLCTNLMTKYLIPNLLNSNLNYMSRIFNIKHNKAHRALDDAEATAELLIKYMNIFISKGIAKINHLYYPRNRYELDLLNYKSAEENAEILNSLEKLTSPFLVTLKGENGIILFSLPAYPDKESIELINKKLHSMPWETTTIKIYGPFLEALMHFSNLFAKIDQAVRQEIIKHLWKKHLPKLKLPQRSGHEEAPQILERDFGDFIVTNHLVPEQMLILPISSIHQKSQLIFRYPSHKKKLLQYINSKISRMSNNKLRKYPTPPQMEEFIENYLKVNKEENQAVFIFRKKLPVASPDKFFEQLDEFLAQNPNTYNYPSDYI